MQKRESYQNCLDVCRIYQGVDFKQTFNYFIKVKKQELKSLY